MPNVHDPKIHVRATWILALALAGLVLAPVDADATIVLKLDTANMSTEASSIVMGRVEARRAFWDGGRIVTEVDIRVALPVKSNAAAGHVITVQQLGGRVDDLVQHVAGAPQFGVGEQLLVFLDRVVDDQPPVVLGMAQGKYQIAVGPDDRLWAVRDMETLSLAVFEESADGHKKMILLDEDAIDEAGAVPLDRLLSDIAIGLKTTGTPIQTPLKDRLGPDLQPGAYDFTVDFEALGPRINGVNR